MCHNNTGEKVGNEGGNNLFLDRTPNLIREAKCSECGWSGLTDNGHCPNCDPVVPTSWMTKFTQKFVCGPFGGVQPQHRDGGVVLRRELEVFIRSVESRAREEERVQAAKSIRALIGGEPYTYHQDLEDLAKSLENK